MDPAPIVLYHGSNKLFEQFNERFSIGSKRRAVTGAYWFSDNIKVAKSYGKIVYETRVLLKNPYVVDANNENFCEIYLSSLPEEIGYQIDILDNKNKGDTHNYMEYYKKSDPDFFLRFDSKDLAWSALRAGYDSLIIKNVTDAGAKSALNIVANTYAIFDLSLISFTNIIIKENAKKCRMVS